MHYKLQMVVHGFLESNRERKRGGVVVVLSQESDWSGSTVGF